MTRASLREYAAVQRERYLPAPRAEKHRLLNEVVAVTGLHRKAAIRLLRRRPGPGDACPRGRPRVYGPAVAAAAQVLWQATGHIGPHRLHPFVPELLDRLLRRRRTYPRPGRRQARPAGEPRHPRPAPGARSCHRARAGGHHAPAPGPGSSTRSRSAPSPSGPTPGRASSRLDLVAHCGSHHPGLLPLHPLRRGHRHRVGRARGRLGQGPERVGGAIHRVRQRLPMPLLGLDSDNGVRVHQPCAPARTAAPGRHLHPQPPLEEERQRPRRAEERRHRPPAHRL